ncbi:lipoyl(octanoyl) transferase LipB [Williamsia muralis]|uniref:lipoyl(octanoyl) transferase LipB n=1 Tax=Williamsia marianensis TaxID=85044 RepID=UPI000DE6B5FF|nr:lipoyl(octanoyl) transferase LipB [Williamsia marianensis]PVY33902.1 lipoyl(octanoyl) transferase [Williamsia marianensis]
MTSSRLSRDPIEVRRLGRVDYQETFDLQHRLASDRADGVLDHDVLLLLEHPPVYTAGRRTEDADRPTDGSPVIDVDRGGKITWHGPGQLVAYPIVALAQPVDVVDYVRRLEEAMIAVCSQLGLPTYRVDGRSGVWVLGDAPEGGARPGHGDAAASADRKIGAIGIRVARAVALHGIAINCNPDLDAFGSIIPCGIPDAGAGSLTGELGRTVTVDEVLPLLEKAVSDALDGTLPVSDHPAPTEPSPQVFAPARTGVASIQ